MQQFRRHRYQTQYPVQVKSRVGTSSAIVLDVNEYGGQIGDIDNVDDLQRGDIVMVSAACDSVKAVIRWKLRDRIGVSFQPMLTTRQVDALRYAKRASAASRFSSVGLQEMR